MENENE
jgi:hypothetical protein